MRQAIESTGASYTSAVESQPELYDDREEDFMGAMECLKKEHGMEEEGILYTMMKLLPLQIELQIPGLLRWMAKIRANAVVYCPLASREGSVAAKIMGLPSIGLLTTAGPGSMEKSLSEFLQMMGTSWEEARAEIRAFSPVWECLDRLKSKWNVDMMLEESLNEFAFMPALVQSEVTLVTTCEELQDPVSQRLAERYRDMKANFVAVGPLLDSAGACRAAGHKLKSEQHVECSHDAFDPLQQLREARLQGKKVIYASMGTVVTGDSPDFGWHAQLQNGQGERTGVTGKQLCQAAWRGLFDLEEDLKEAVLLVSVGPQADALEGLEVPKNAFCSPTLPQVDILKEGVDVFLTHGGQNSFTESMANGVPVVVCPGFGDQPVNAKKAAELGVGLQVPRPEAESGLGGYSREVKEALRRVLAEGSFREQSKRCEASLQRAGGVERAVEITKSVAKAPRLQVIYFILFLLL